MLFADWYRYKGLRKRYEQYESAYECHEKQLFSDLNKIKWTFILTSFPKGKKRK